MECSISITRKSINQIYSATFKMFIVGFESISTNIKMSNILFVTLNVSVRDALQTYKSMPQNAFGIHSGYCVDQD